MKLLFLTPQLPHPPRQGTALRNWGLISHLAARGHQISLLSFDEDASSSAGCTSELPRACARIVRVRVPQRSGGDRLRTLVTSSLPDMAWRLWSPDFRDALVDFLKEVRQDVVQVEGIELARYLFDERVAPLLPRVVFDDHNCEYLLQRRAFLSDLRRPRRWHGAAYSFVQSLRLRAFERRILDRAEDTLCVSEQDRRVLSALAPAARVHVVCNGIDVVDYASSGPLPAGLSSEDAALVFTGKMDFRPNIDAALWFARDVLPEVARAVPNVKLLLVGQKPGVRLDVLRNDSRVCITGAVPQVQPYIGAASVYIAPLLAGGGTRFKLLEAMAMGRAVVSTRLGAEGFDVESGRELMLADAAQDFARAVIALLIDPQRRAELGARARAFVQHSYDWSAIVPKLEEVYAAHHRPA